MDFTHNNGDLKSILKGVVRSSTGDSTTYKILKDLIMNQHYTNLIGLIVGHEFIDGCGLGDL